MKKVYRILLIVLIVFVSIPLLVVGITTIHNTAATLPPPGPDSGVAFSRASVVEQMAPRLQPPVRQSLELPPLSAIKSQQPTRHDNDITVLSAARMGEYAVSASVPAQAQAQAPASLRVGQSWISPAAIRFMAVPGGSFQMGTPSGGHSYERPVRTVTLSSFWMSATEVTQEQWQALMGSNPSDPRFTIVANARVNQVSWYDALVFCNRLSIREGRTPVYSIGGSTDPARWGAVPNNQSTTWDAVRMDRAADGYRLPTEAEWEYAARGGPASPWYTRLPWYTRAGKNDLNSVASHGENSVEYRPLGSKTTNKLGLYRMDGNVWEWVWDWFGRYPSSAETDPTGPVSGSYRAYRNGCWEHANRGVGSPNRDVAYPNFRIVNMGFRLVRTSR